MQKRCVEAFGPSTPPSGILTWTWIRYGWRCRLDGVNYMRYWSGREIDLELLTVYNDPPLGRIRLTLESLKLAQKFLKKEGTLKPHSSGRTNKPLMSPIISHHSPDAWMPPTSTTSSQYPLGAFMSPTLPTRSGPSLGASKSTIKTRGLLLGLALQGNPIRRITLHLLHRVPNHQGAEVAR